MITTQLFKNTKTGEIVDTVPMMSISDYVEYPPSFETLNVSVYRSSGSDCTNGGPSSFYETVQLVYLEGAQIERYDMLNHQESFVSAILDTPDLEPIAEKVFVSMQLTQGRDQPYHYAVPLSILLEGKQSMAGGNLLACSDSRFRRIAQALAIHDRVES